MTSNDMICEDFCVGFPTLAMVLAINCQGPAQGGRQGGQNTAGVARGSNLLDVSYQDNYLVSLPQSLREMKR